MPELTAVPGKLVDQLIEDHGPRMEFWNDELRDLVDPTISARQMNPPLSGQIKLRKNRDFQYFWAFDRCGATPDHSRVEELRSQGWDFATTNDVDMYSEDSVRGRDKNKFSNEIRSGDRRLMKIPMQRWREHRKASNVLAYQYAYPQAFSGDGKPMSSRNLIPGVKTQELQVGSPQMQEFEASRIVSDPAKDLERVGEGGKPLGNTAVHRVQKET